MLISCPRTRLAVQLQIYKLEFPLQYLFPPADDQVRATWNLISLRSFSASMGGLSQCLARPGASIGLRLFGQHQSTSNGNVLPRNFLQQPYLRTGTTLYRIFFIVVYFTMTSHISFVPTELCEMRRVCRYSSIPLLTIVPTSPHFRSGRHFPSNF